MILGHPGLSQRLLRAVLWYQAHTLQDRRASAAHRTTNRDVIGLLILSLARYGPPMIVIIDQVPSAALCDTPELCPEFQLLSMAPGLQLADDIGTPALLCQYSRLLLSRT